jgi:hypothetical protein
MTVTTEAAVETRSRRAHAALATVPIAAAAAHRAELLASHFSPVEAAALGRRPPGTTAGFLAVKAALCELYQGLEPPRAVSALDFVLGHDGRGAPVLLAAPPLPGRVLTISLSHTRDRAYGLAVADEVGRG